MSPRRMDISSLLRDPSPPRQRRPDRPRTIDALLHPTETPPAAFSPANQTTPSPPFLRLDTLVHIANEEHRRINALSDRDVPRFSAQDATPRPSLLHDRDCLPTHYSYPSSSYSAPIHHHPDLPSPHKRARDTFPPSPSSQDPSFSHLTSPRTRHHSSASPVNNYPTLRRQLIDPTPSRSAPAFMPANDSRFIPLQQTSPFLHPHSPPQVLSHSSPRNDSPLHHSPPHLSSLHHSSPILTTALAPAPAESDAMLPRYSHGPKMAGGVELLSNDPSSTRDALRPDLSNYQALGRDVSVERFVSNSRSEHGRHEPSKLSSQALPSSYDPQQPGASPHDLDGQGYVSRMRSHSHFAMDVTVDNTTSQSSSEFYPVRVWEEPILGGTPRRAPVHMPSMANPVEVSWPGADEIGHSKQSARQGWRTELQQGIVENTSTPLLSAGKEPAPRGASKSKRLASGSPIVVKENSLDSSLFPAQPQSPIQPTHVSQILHLDSSAPCTPPSPILSHQLESFEAEYEHQPTRSNTPVDSSTSALLTSSEPVLPETAVGKAKQISGSVDASDILMADSFFRQPSPQLAQSALAEDGGMSVHPTRATTSRDSSRSPHQSSLHVLSPARDECGASPGDALVSPVVPLDAPRRSREPEDASERVLPASEQTMMDVDEELLSLVEDRHIPIISPSRMRAESRSPLPIKGGEGINASVGRESNEPSDGPPLALSSQPALHGPPPMRDKEKDRSSMPPPAPRNKKSEKGMTTQSVGVAMGAKKKKDGTSKSAPKSKHPSRPRPKPVPKPKVKPTAVDSLSKATISKSTVNVDARSRSTSVMPGITEDIVPEPNINDSDKEDDKLYCVCKTRYDEDRVMIACDRCDEWFHTLCVNIPDLEIDLVDQFICPQCVQKYPHLRTTWKRRCLFGPKHENPLSSEACHKPSRGAFSKYCSDDCGIRYMRAHIAQWERSGGVRDLLWESVKNATKREGVVVCTRTDRTNPTAMNVDSSDSARKPLDFAAKRRAEREIARLDARLEVVVKEREFMKRELDIVIWREKVVELASERAGKVDECGWDQRLCFGEEEWADFGPEVLESYEDLGVKAEPGDDTMPPDSADTIHGEWWCTGKKKCERHAGWQKLRVAEVSFDKETKEGILLKLTTREREIRKCIEDILYPQAFQVSSKPPHSEIQLNGLEKLHTKGAVSESGKNQS